jgi:penicillin-binding protein 2
MGLALSCDVYFWNIGLRTRGDTIERYERAFGLGSKTNIALRGEKSGHVFGPDARHRSKRGWYDGDTLNLSIGQGELLVTPIQMAVVTAALASRGVLWRPHYTQKIVYEDGRPTYVQAPERLPDNGLNIKDSVWDDVQRALEVTVSSGTGTPASIPGLIVAGKTATAQNPHGEDHAWFIAYAAKPGEAASIAVAVLIENGGHGGVTAAPVARKMILAHFQMKDPLIEKAERAAARAAAREARLAPPTPLLNTPGVPR